MKKNQYEKLANKDKTFKNKAALYTGVYVLTLIVLLLVMFVVQALTTLITFIVILVIAFILFRFVFHEYILFFLKRKEIARIDLHHEFLVNDEVIEYFGENAFQNIYDDDFTLLQKNDVFVIAKKRLDNTVHDLAIAVYFYDLKTEAVCPSLQELNREMSSYALSPSTIKVILTVAKVFTDEEKDTLKYDAQGHKNTVIIGLEQESKKLYYNYFLNGVMLDTYLSTLFKVDLIRKESE